MIHSIKVNNDYTHIIRSKKDINANWTIYMNVLTPNEDSSLKEINLLGSWNYKDAIEFGGEE
ncbi:MAG: hypothetical protein KDK36_18170 [Leptospiraceae bacterium]|nr:hypothetical protein [Leptospiraceae bacterium]